MSDDLNDKAKEGGVSSMFLKVPGKTKTAFEKALESYPDKISLAKAVERLLNYFLDLPDNQKHSILAGEVLPSDRYTRLIDLIGDFEAAEHFFQLKRWVPTIEGYEIVLKISEGLPKVQNWARYKLGYSWIDMAYNRREAGLLLLQSGVPREEVLEEFTLAIRAIEESISYNETAIASGIKPPVRIISQFNLSCAYSLGCQYLIEKALVSGGEIDNILENPDDMRKEFSKEIFNKEGLAIKPNIAINTFNMLYEKDRLGPLSDPVWSLFRKAITCLEEISKELGTVHNHDEESRGSHVSASWIVQLMSEDGDLTFIKEASPMKSEFERIRKILASKTETVKAWCNRKLRNPLNPRETV